MAHQRDIIPVDPNLENIGSNAGVYSRPDPGNASPSATANPLRLPTSTSQYLQDGQSQHQNPYQPHTPQSAGHTTTPNSIDGGHHEQGDVSNDPKRPRACEACRGLKVRCEPDANNPDGPCKRCAKANRQCLITVPSRKRQKKTDSRVAELEKKIDALTASLQATKSASAPVGHGNENEIKQEVSNSQARHNPYEQVTNGSYVSSYGGPPEARMASNEWTASERYPKVPEYEARKSAPPPMVMAGQKRKHTDSRDYTANSEARSSVATGGTRKSIDATNATQRQYGYSDAGGGSKTPKPTQTHEYADVIDRGIVTADTATHMFNSYVENMAPHMPVVVFPPGTTAAEVRRSKPTLFLAILSASSGTSYPELQRMLTKEVMNIYADRIIGNGEKTLELIQALHISTLWYWPPEHYEELKFYQLIHIAAVMAIDIGLGKKNKPHKTINAGLWREHAWRRTPYPDPEAIEARRAWLGCYWLCGNASMGLRRPNLVRWAPYMADCLDILENSPEAFPSDKFLCQWVRSQHIAEEVGVQFSMDDPSANVSIADSKVQYALKGFERDIEKWSSNISNEVQSPILKMTEHVVNLYMHEVAMHVDHNVDEFKPPFTEKSLRGANTEPVSLTPAHISALSICLTSIDGIFETFLSLDIEVIRCLPIAHFVRVAYAVVVLIKMYFAAATPNSELGKVINKDNMKVEQYLDGLVETFRAAAANEKSRPASKFLMVLLMLKTWFQRQKDGRPPSSTQAEISTALIANSTRVHDDNVLSTDAPGEENQNSPRTTAPQQHGQSQRSGYDSTNTPLQLLSEVATGKSRGQARVETPAHYSSTPGEWNQQQPQQQNYGTYDHSMNQLPPTISQGYGMNIDPALSMGLEYTIGGGFEQAIGMTLGDGYFSDDAFFGSLMDSVGGPHGHGFEGM